MVVVASVGGTFPSSIHCVRPHLTHSLTHSLSHSAHTHAHYNTFSSHTSHTPSHFSVITLIVHSAHVTLTGWSLPPCIVPFLVVYKIANQPVSPHILLKHSTPFSVQFPLPYRTPRLSTHSSLPEILLVSFTQLSLHAPVHSFLLLHPSGTPCSLICLATLQ